MGLTVTKRVKRMADEKIPYPKAVFFIVSNEFCERFCYYGMRTILVLYLSDQLKFKESNAKMTYHAFTMMVYFFPLIGAIISDTWLGKFKTILYISMIYASGCVLLSLSGVKPLKLPQKACSLMGLFLIATGTGGIKPCVSSFGGDQFTLPQHENQLAKFFSLFYFAINAGSLMSTFITPILRNDVHCFKQHSCYPLAFALPGMMMILAIVIFALGRPLYKVNKPEGNILVNVVKCICHAIVHRKTENPGNHWLDRSQPKFGAQLVDDVKILLKILVIFIPLPVFWALFDQQASGWTFLAVRMNGDIGFYTILPDQMMLTNPLLILIFIPIFTYVVYPVFAKCHLLKRPLQRLCAGMIMAALSFAMSAFLAIALEKTYPLLPQAGEAQLRIYDTTNCQYSFSTADDQVPGAEIGGYYLHTSITIPNEVQTVSFNFTPKGNGSNCEPREITIGMKEKTEYGIYLNNDGVSYFIDEAKKSEDGYPLLRTLTSNSSTTVTYTHINKGKDQTITGGDTSLVTVEYVGAHLVNHNKIEFKLGGTYTVIINEELNTLRTIVVTEPNSMHILWLLPQYIVITAAEVMFSITGLEFAYSQAPISMKAVLQACYLLNNSIGNLLVVVIEAMKISDLYSWNSLLYCGLMVADMLLFTFLAVRYKYVDPTAQLPNE